MPPSFSRRLSDGTPSGLPTAVGPSSASAERAAGFADLGVSEPVVAALAGRGIQAPLAIQSLVLADAIAGRDVLARSSTGSGKTLAFAVPVVERLARHGRPGALVLVPTRELTTQVAGEFHAIAEARGLSVATVYGGVGIAKQLKAATRADIVVATPGRLLGLLQRRLLRLNLDGDVSRLAARLTIDPVRHDVAERRACRPRCTAATSRSSCPALSRWGQTPPGVPWGSLHVPV